MSETGLLAIWVLVRLCVQLNPTLSLKSLARVVKLVNTPGLGPDALKSLEVRVLSRAPITKEAS